MIFTNPYTPLVYDIIASKNNLSVIEIISEAKKTLPNTSDKQVWNACDRLSRLGFIKNNTPNNSFATYVLIKISPLPEDLLYAKLAEDPKAYIGMTKKHITEMAKDIEAPFSLNSALTTLRSKGFVTYNSSDKLYSLNKNAKPTMWNPPTLKVSNLSTPLEKVAEYRESYEAYVQAQRQLDQARARFKTAQATKNQAREEARPYLPFVL